MSTGGINQNLVRTAPNGAIYHALVGATAPTSATSSLGSEWHHSGLLDEEGVSLSPDVSATAIRKWQSLLPVKYSLDEVSLEITGMMNQFDRDNASLYWFGAQWENIAGGQSKLTIPAAPTITDLERALIIEYTDDRGDMNRFYFPRTITIEREEITLNKADVKLAVTYHVMSSGDEMGEFFTENADLYSA